MGILDDAIRQHLELKRQHGAPEEELQRQEEEALGPARRDVAPAEPSGGDGEVELEAPDDAVDAASEQETELFDDDAALEHAEAEPTPSAGPDTPFEPDEEPEHEAVSEGVPEPDALPPSPAPFDADSAYEGFGEQDEPDEEEPVEEEPEGRREPDPDDSDVLEDTPDFLQETPEHDRLWFEQKPPRDFDFD
jgi:hypothetical protein